MIRNSLLILVTGRNSVVFTKTEKLKNDVRSHPRRAMGNTSIDDVIDDIIIKRFYCLKICCSLWMMGIRQANWRNPSRTHANEIFKVIWIFYVFIVLSSWTTSRSVGKLRKISSKQHQPPCEYAIKISFIIHLFAMRLSLNSKSSKLTAVVIAIACVHRTWSFKRNYNIFTFRKSSGVDRKSWEHFFPSFICITLETRGHTKLEIAERRRRVWM